MQADANVQRLLRVTLRLVELVERENECLDERRPQELTESRAEKERLAELYQTELEILRKNPRILEAADAEDMARLKAAVGRFNATLDEHRRRLLAAKTVSERVLKTVSDEVTLLPDSGPGGKLNTALEGRDDKADEAVIFAGIQGTVGCPAVGAGCDA